MSLQSCSGIKINCIFSVRGTEGESENKIYIFLQMGEGFFHALILSTERFKTTVGTEFISSLFSLRCNDQIRIIVN